MNVCVSGAGVSSEQMIRIAALKLPASSLLVTTAANLLDSDVFLVALLNVCCAAYQPPVHLGPTPRYSLVNNIADVSVSATSLWLG